MIKDADLLLIEEANIKYCYKLKINQKVEVVKVKCHKVKIGVQIFHSELAFLYLIFDFILIPFRRSRVVEYLCRNSWLKINFNF